MLSTSCVTPPASRHPGLVPLSEEKIQSLTIELSGPITAVFENHDETLRRMEANRIEIATIKSQIEQLLQELAGYTQELVEESVDRLKQRDEQLRLCSALESKKAQLLIELDQANKLVAEGKAQIERGMAMKAQAVQLKVEAAKHGEEARRLSESAAKHKENAAQHHAKGEELRASAARHRAEGERLRASAAAKMNPILCKYFFETFYGPKCPVSTENKEQFFATYIARGELGVKIDSVTGKPVPLINDTTPFVVMSQMHRELTNCNLTRFTIVDVTALATYLASPDCSIRRIFVNSKNSPEVEQLLTHAAAQRGGKLEVKILTPPSSSAASSSSGQP